MRNSQSDIFRLNENESQISIETLTNIDITDLIFFNSKNDTVICLEDYLKSPQHAGSVLTEDETCDSIEIQKSNKKKSYKRRKDKQCKVCDKTFTTTTKLKMHSRVHSGLKPFKCSKCPKTFTQEYNLKRHEMTHLPANQRKKRFQCHNCELSFWQKHHLKDHLLACHVRGSSKNGSDKIICDISHSIE
uniref:CSON014797 protein n=1 Tax=Culicoides sonorensis TaxID=179676 RepID=A0A336LN03_CULSO